MELATLLKMEIKSPNGTGQFSEIVMSPTLSSGSGHFVRDADNKLSKENVK